MTKNRGASYKFYQKAYDLGGRDGVAQLAFLYDEGIGTPQNTRRANELYREALPCNDRAVYHNLGVNMVRLQKYAEAELLFQQGADLGNPDDVENRAWPGCKR